MICAFCGKEIKNPLTENWDRVSITFPNGFKIHGIAPICGDCINRLGVDCQKYIKELGLFKPFNK